MENLRFVCTKPMNLLGTNPEFCVNRYVSWFLTKFLHLFQNGGRLGFIGFHTVQFMSGTKICKRLLYMGKCRGICSPLLSSAECAALTLQIRNNSPYFNVCPLFPH